MKRCPQVHPKGFVATPLVKQAYREIPPVIPATPYPSQRLMAYSPGVQLPVVKPRFITAGMAPTFMPSGMLMLGGLIGLGLILALILRR